MSTTHTPEPDLHPNNLVPDEAFATPQSHYRWWLNQYPKCEMRTFDDTETRSVMALTMMSLVGDQVPQEIRDLLPCQIAALRLKSLLPQHKFSDLIPVFIGLMSKNPAMAVMYSHIIANRMAEPMDPAAAPQTFDLKQCLFALTPGIPTDAALRDLWDKQKRSYYKRIGDNMLDMF